MKHCYHRKPRKHGCLYRKVRWIGVGWGIAIVCFLAVAWFSPYLITRVVEKVGNFDVAGVSTKASDPLVFSKPVGSGGTDGTTNEIIHFTASVEDKERAVLALVNIIREDRGVAPLIWDDSLYVYAKNHSGDMAEQGRLFHSPIKATYAENCWGGGGCADWSANTIMESWLSSPEHRTWLVNPHLKSIAVGITVTGSGAYACWTFWRDETHDRDWWYVDAYRDPPKWWQ